MADFTAYPGEAPCLGDVPALSDAWNQAVDHTPIYAGYLASKGSGSTVSCIRSNGSIDAAHDLTISNPGGLSNIWSATGHGYELTCPAHATNFVNMRATSVSLMPGSNSAGFTATILAKAGASYSSGQGFFEKVSLVTGTYSRVKGYGVYISGTKVRGWIDSTSKIVELPVSTLPAAGEYFKISLSYDGNDILSLRIDTSAGTTVANASVGAATTLNSTTNLSDLFVGSAAASSPGTTCMGGAFVSFCLWKQKTTKEDLDALYDNPFDPFTLPRSQLLTLELPNTSLSGGISRFGLYISPNFDPDSDYLIIDVPGTPSSTYTGQTWMEYTFGLAADLATVRDYNDFGTPHWKTIADRSNYAILIPITYYTGGGTFGSSTITTCDCDIKIRAAIDHLRNLLNRPLPAAHPTQVHITGWSAGGSEALEFAMRNPDYVGSASCRSSYLCYGGDAASTSSNMDFIINNLGTTNRTWVTPPVWAWGAAISTATPGSGSSSGAYSPPRSINWKTNVDTPTHPMLALGGTNDPDSNMAQNIVTQSVLRGFGYYQFYVKAYNGGSDDPQGGDLPHLPPGGVRALHCRSRDLVEQFLTEGAASFFPTNSGGSQLCVFGWGDHPKSQGNPYF